MTDPTEGWVVDGQPMTAQGDVVYLHRHDSDERFYWGGCQMRVEESTEVLGGFSTTQKRDPRGGLKRDSVLLAVPGETTFTLAMKRVHYDRKKTALKSCMWDIDQRSHCGGINIDAPFEWLEIRRHWMSKAGERVSSGSAYDGDDEEQMVSFNFVSLETADIYRLSGSEEVAGIGGGDKLLDVAVTFSDRCPTSCDPESGCRVVAVTEDDAANSYLLTSVDGGDTWTSNTLTDFGANDADAVTGAGEFVFVLSYADATAIYSDDFGVTQVNVVSADWASHPPRDTDMLNQAYIVISGDDGYMWASYDAGRTIVRLDPGSATASDLTRVQICRTNPAVIYTISSAADVVVKSVNHGKTFFAVTATGTAGTGPLSLCILNENHVLVGTDAGEIFETMDGGVTWTEQAEIPGLTTKANTDINDIIDCGFGVLRLLTADTVAGEYRVFENVDNGASGFWYEPDGVETLTAEHERMASCNQNHAVSVGGVAGASSAVLVMR